ncbi:MAG TPA: archease [Thermoanaerobaculia bacterium]|nr:archease [Thermoanaerobaculia bacterium]
MYELVHHTADVRLRVSAPSLEELFHDAVLGMYAVMRGEAGANARDVQRTIAVDESPDTTALLVDFLNDVLHRAHIARELFTAVTFTRFDGTSLTAELTGIAPASFEEDVKAVTYHEADVRREGEAWVTMLVFDL